MNRILQILNLVGILVLATLCVIQWQANRRLNHQIIHLETLRDQQADKIANQQTNLDGLAADLNDFRARLSAAQSDRKDAQSKSAAADTQAKQLTMQRDQLQATVDALKATLDKWTAAVASRDEAQKGADAQLQSLANDRNGAIQKFNDLASKYNTAVEEIKKANEAIKSIAQERDNAVQKFNDLAAKYNALLTPTTRSTTP